MINEGKTTPEPGNSWRCWKVWGVFWPFFLLSSQFDHCFAYGPICLAQYTMCTTGQTGTWYEQHSHVKIFLYYSFESLWSISYTHTSPEWQDPFGCQGDLRRQLCDLCEIPWRLELSSTVAQGLACEDIKRSDNSDMIWYDMIWYDLIWYDTIWSDEIRRSPLRNHHDLGSRVRESRKTFWPPSDRCRDLFIDDLVLAQVLLWTTTLSTG